MSRTFVLLDAQDRTTPSLLRAFFKESA